MGRYCRLLQENGRLRVLHKGPVPPSWIQRESQGSRKVLQGYRRLEPILEANAGANIHGRFKRVIMHIASPFLPPIPSLLFDQLGSYSLLKGSKGRCPECLSYSS